MSIYILTFGEAVHEMDNEMLVTVDVGQEVLAATDTGHEELVIIGTGDV